MNHTTKMKTVRYLKVNTAKILEELAESGEPIIITQNGKARAILQDIVSYCETQETLTLLQILALGNREIKEGKIKVADDVFANICRKI